MGTVATQEDLKILATLISKAFVMPEYVVPGASKRYWDDAVELFSSRVLWTGLRTQDPRWVSIQAIHPKCADPTVRNHFSDNIHGVAGQVRAAWNPISENISEVFGMVRSGMPQLRAQHINALIMPV